MRIGVGLFTTAAKHQAVSVKLTPTSHLIVPVNDSHPTLRMITMIVRTYLSLQTEYLLNQHYKEKEE